MHHAPLLVVGHCIVLHGPVVPQRDGPLSPAEANLELGPLEMPIEKWLAMYVLYAYLLSAPSPLGATWSTTSTSGRVDDVERNRRISISPSERAKRTWSSSSIV